MKDKLEKLKAKNAELQKALANQNPTQEDVNNIKALTAEVQALSDEVNALKSADDAARSVNEMLSQPATKMAFDNGAQELGSRPAGETQLTTQKDGSVLIEQYGEGVLDDRQLKAICSPEYKRAFRGYLQRKGNINLLDTIDQKALQEGSDSSGGFLVPDEFLAQVISRKPTPTRVAGRTSTFTTSRDSLTIPKVIYTTDDLYTTGIRVTNTGEVPASSTTHRATEPVWGQVRVPVYTHMLSMPLTKDLLEDSAVDVQGYAAGKFRETIDLWRDNKTLNGTGIGEMTGIMLSPDGTIGNQDQITSVGCADPITAAGIIGLGWSLPEQYDEEAVWVMNKTNTGKYIAGLLDSNNRPIWTSGLGDSGIRNAPSPKNPMLLNYDVLFSGFMPNRASNAFPLLFGDLRGFARVDRIGFSIQILSELYAETNQILMLGRMRVGGQIIEPWRLRAGKQAAIA